MNKFANFNSFDFMFKRLSRPLKITTFELGSQKTIDVNEPLTVTNNPAITFQNGSGGDVPIYQAVWVSRTPGCRKETKVTDTLTGTTYTVTGITENMVANLVYYQLTKDEEEVNDKQPHDNGHADSWY